MLVVHLGRALKAPLTGLSLRPLIILSIIVYLFAVVCIGQLRHKGEESERLGPPGVDASPIALDDDDLEDEESSPIGVTIETTQLVKRSVAQNPVKTRNFDGPLPSNSIGGGDGSSPDDDDDDRDDDDDDDGDDDGESSEQRRKSTGGNLNEKQQANQQQQQSPSLINRIMNLGGFRQAAGVFGGAGEQQKNSQEPDRARLFKLGLLIGR